MSIKSVIAGFKKNLLRNVMSLSESVSNRVITNSYNSFLVFTIRVDSCSESRKRLVRSLVHLTRWNVP